MKVNLTKKEIKSIINDELHTIELKEKLQEALDKCKPSVDYTLSNDKSTVVIIANGLMFGGDAEFLNELIDNATITIPGVDISTTKKAIVINGNKIKYKDLRGILREMVE